jgi:hypothetical protein
LIMTGLLGARVERLLMFDAYVWLRVHGKLQRGFLQFFLYMGRPERIV